MADDMLLAWLFAFAIGVYLFIGLLIASRRMGRGSYSHGSGTILQFILEVLLWPAANIIDPDR